MTTITDSRPIPAILAGTQRPPAMQADMSLGDEPPVPTSAIEEAVNGFNDAFVRMLAKEFASSQYATKPEKALLNSRNLDRKREGLVKFIQRQTNKALEAYGAELALRLARPGAVLDGEMVDDTPIVRGQFESAGRTAERPGTPRRSNNARRPRRGRSAWNGTPVTGEQE
jgi:hypothetical protein